MNSLSIRIILICGLVALTLCALYVLRSRLATRLFLALQLLAGVLLVIFPEAANWMAGKVGVGRGTDLIFYQITDLARQVALKNPQEPKSK